MTRMFLAAAATALVGVGGVASFNDEKPMTEAALAPSIVEMAKPALVMESRPTISSMPQAMDTGIDSPKAARPLKGYEKMEILSQSYGTVCETPRGECTVSPLPINGLCTCGGTPGKIIR